MVKRPENMKNTLKNLQNFIPRKLKKQNKILQKNQEGVKVEPASKLSLVSGNYLQPKVPDGVDLASAEAEIRHVFGDTPITEASIGAAPPGNNIAQWLGLTPRDLRAWIFFSTDSTQFVGSLLGAWMSRGFPSPRVGLQPPSLVVRVTRVMD